jgi:Flp pilus assembly protein TadG
MKRTLISRDFGRDEDGNVAMIFGLSLFLIVGMIGGAVDIGRVMTTRQTLQEVADYAALNLAATAANDIRDSTSFKTSATTDSQAQSLVVAQQRAAEMGANNVTLTAAWKNTTDLTVSVTSVYPAVFTAAVPGLPKTFNISATATARSNQQLEQAAKPSQVSLGYDAWDYNRVYMYCFDKSSKNNAAKNYGRSQMVAIASNGVKSDGSNETFSYTPPTCAAGETVSFRLYNVRAGSTAAGGQRANTNPSAWNQGSSVGGSYTCATVRSTSADCYDWYTDTERTDAGVDTYKVSPYQLETILCDTPNCSTVTAGNGVDTAAAQNLVKDTGGRQTNRPPMQAKGCQAGKYMYFGWEDRPPINNTTTGQPLATGVVDGGGDRDYDDIRVIMNCPQYVAGSRTVKLVQ